MFPFDIFQNGFDFHLQIDNIIKSFLEIDNRHPIENLTLPDFCHLVLKFPSMTHCIVSNDLECHRIQRSIVINVIQKIFYTKS